MTDKEALAMFGVTFVALETQFRRMTPADKLLAAMSILSDTQEALPFNDYLRREQTRQRLNVAKWLISEVRAPINKAERAADRGPAVPLALTLAEASALADYAAGGAESDGHDDNGEAARAKLETAIREARLAARKG